VNIILVLGSERLYSEMQRRFSSYTGTAGEPLTLVKLDKSGGCVDRDESFIHQSREASIREYFFGDAKRTLSPHTQYINFDEIAIYKIYEGTFTLFLKFEVLTNCAVENSHSAFIGDDEVGEPEQYEKVEPSVAILHSLLAVMHAAVLDTVETIRDATVMGFVYVAEVDEKKRRLKILAPLNTRFTDKPLVWGSWPERTMGLIG
jgi:polyribonucleotide 5'-hydroxyl-kinase